MVQERTMDLSLWGVGPKKPPSKDRPITSRLQDVRTHNGWAEQQDFEAKLHKDDRRSKDLMYFKEILESAPPPQPRAMGSTTSPRARPTVPTTTNSPTTTRGSGVLGKVVEKSKLDPTRSRTGKTAGSQRRAYSAAGHVDQGPKDNSPAKRSPRNAKRGGEFAGGGGTLRGGSEVSSAHDEDRASLQRGGEMVEVLGEIEEFEHNLSGAAKKQGSSTAATSRKITPFHRAAGVVVPPLDLSASARSGVASPESMKGRPRKHGLRSGGGSLTERSVETASVRGAGGSGAATDRSQRLPEMMAMTSRGGGNRGYFDDDVPLPKAPLTVRSLKSTKWPKPEPVNASRAMPLDQKGSRVIAAGLEPFILTREVYNCAGDTTDRLKKELLNDKLGIRGPPMPGAALEPSPWVAVSPLRPGRVHSYRYEWSDYELTSKDFRNEFFGRGGPDTEVWQSAVRRKPVLSLQPWTAAYPECEEAQDASRTYRAMPPGHPGDFRASIVRDSESEGYRWEKFSLVTDGKHTTTLSSFVPNSERQRDAIYGGRYYRSEVIPVGWHSPRKGKEIPAGLPQPTAGWSSGPVAQTSLGAGEHGQFVPMRWRMESHDYRDTGPEPGEDERKWADYSKRSMMGSDTRGYMRFGKPVTKRFQSLKDEHAASIQGLREAR